MVETWLQKHYATQHYAASSVNWIFKEQGQVDLELHLLGDAIAAAFSNQCSQSGSFEPPSKHSADSAANKLVIHVSLFGFSYDSIATHAATILGASVILRFHGLRPALRQCFGTYIVIFQGPS